MPEIRRMIPVQGLAQALAEVHRDGFSQAWDSASFESLLFQPGITVWGAISADQEELIGFAMVRAASVELEVLTIAVRSVHRRQGVAEAVLASVFRELGANCETVFLEVDSQNAAALHLYRKLGFETIGERPKYYKHVDGTVGDAIVMSRKLGTL